MNGELTFIGTATVLLRVGAFTVLTDPNFLHAGERATLGYGLRSRRLLEPARQINELPPLDLVVLSHHHGDHFDDVAARELDKDLPIVTEPSAARKLRHQGFREPVALRTWQERTFEKDGERLCVTAMPGKHAPMPIAALLPPVMGSMLDFWTAHGRLRVYITGDTLLHDRLEEIPHRFRHIDLCLIHLGGTRIAGILLTMDAEQGIRALNLIQPRMAVPIHTDDYTVFRSPLSEFRTAVDRAGTALPTTVHYVERGVPWTFPVGTSLST